MTFHAVCARVMRGAACSPRKRSARRAARGASSRLVLLFVLLQMVASLVFPCGAVALSPNDQGVLWGPTSLGGGNSGIVVSATNNFDAALWAIGRWNTKIQLDNDMFAKLSNDGTGGHFYELASYFHSYSEVGSPNWPNAVAVEGYAISLGPDNVWLASVPSSLISQAREDYNTVLGGGSLGGTSGSDPNILSFGSGYVQYNRSTSSYGNKVLRVTDGTTTISNLVKSDGTAYNDALFANSCSFVVDLGNVSVDWSSLPSDIDYSDFFLHLHTRSSNLSSNSPYYLDVCYVSDGSANVSMSSAGGLTYSYVDSVSVPSGTYYKLNAMFQCDATYDSGVFRLTCNPASAGYVYRFSSANAASVTFSAYAASGFNSRASVGPVVPPVNNWPTDAPTPTPDPPEVPGPSDDPVVEPDPPDLPNPVTYPVSDPYTPDPDPPANPVVTYDPNPTGEPTDYRPWLNAILVLLRKINTTLSDGFGDLRGWLTNHCDHIREQIHSDSLDLGVHIQTAIQNGFVSFERWLQGTFAGYFFDEMDYLLGENFRELEGYLYDLFHWLASQFDFTFGGTSYDDSSVIYWLRRIYARLGGGAPNPGDDGTVDDGFDWWAWLLGLITDALGGIITDFVGDVGGFLATLADVFPFSIPGDIVAYLTLLDAARATPRFVVTIPAIQGWWQSYDYEIDLSPFDDAMGVVRGMFLIYWGLVLAMKTDWLGGVFDFATRAVVQFFDKITGGAYSA